MRGKGVKGVEVRSKGVKGVEMWVGGVEVRDGGMTARRLMSGRPR